MIGRATLPWLALAAVLAVGASYGVGRWQGHSAGVAHERAAQQAARARAQADLNRLGEKVAAQAGELIALERERESLVQSLEDQARNARGADGAGVSTTGGLLRLEQRWGPR